MNSLRLLISDSYDPRFNLGGGRMHLPRDDHAKILFLWRNAETVVIGQSQNPGKSATPGAWSRTAFGWRGAAAAAGRYFTTGNTCFTFMAGKPGYDKSVSTDIILQALRQLGVTAGASGRNDLVMETADGPRKISGSAYRETGTVVSTTARCC